MSHTHPHGELHNVDTAHEHSDINIAAIVGFIVVLTGITLAIQVGVGGMFVLLNKIEAKDDPVVSPVAAPAGQAPPEPRLQTTPWTDLKKLKAEEASHLHGYGWIDQQAGVAHVPIDKAKAMLLQKGIPVRPDLADATEGTRIAATGESSGGRNLAAGGADKSTAVPARPAGATAPSAPAASTKPAEPAKAGSETSKKPGGGHQ